MSSFVEHVRRCCEALLDEVCGGLDATDVPRPGANGGRCLLHQLQNFGLYQPEVGLDHRKVRIMPYNRGMQPSVLLLEQRRYSCDRLGND
jgi:hypothetical protein